MARTVSSRHRRWIAGCAVLAVPLPVGVTGPAQAQPDAPATVEPVVVSSFDTSAAGGGARPLIGDVTGDGRLDIVMMQPHFIADDRFEGALVAALTAYDIEGNLLWQAGRVDPRGRNQGSDIPAQIHDVDGDGDNEVVAIMHPGGDTSVEGRFMIFDGRTGALVRDFALPHRQAHDAILFVNLSGGNTAREILLKDRYDRVWALDNQGDLLWTRAANTGHYPWPYDFNGDGRQEIMVGYHLLSPDGEELWVYDGGDSHADSMWMADITGDGLVEIMQGGDAAIAFDAHTGTQLWRQEDIVETQNIMTGDFIPELPGLESLGLDRIDRSAQGYDGLFLLDVTGEFVWKEERASRGCWGSIPEPIHNWTGDYRDLIMVWNRGCGEPTTIMDGNGNVVSTLDSGARLWHADFCGDDKEEVVEYVQGVSVTIKSNGPCDLDAKVTGVPLPQAKRLYNYSRYTAGDSPVDLAGDRPTTTGGALPGHGGDRANDGDDATAWRPRTARPGQSWQVDLGRWYTLSGIALTFPQAPPGLERTGRAYRFGYTVEVSTDGQDWVTVLDRTTNDLASRTQRALFTGLGQHVRVTITGLPPGTASHAGLAEVAVLGHR
jgi:outer membrane protein assembly factor BamB